MTGRRFGGRFGWQLTCLLFIAALLGGIFAPTAAADAAGPTDYQSEIASIEPPTSAIAVSMIGGDSFVQLELIEPVEVLVVGYRGEDYLRFDADGTVHQNLRSPSTWLNEERYGTEEEFPPFVDYQAPPQWEQVAEGGTYSWHDHRSHWMNPQRPPGASAGDQVLEATIPLLVDGSPVTVTVTSFLLPGPSRLSTVAGFIAGAVLAGALGWRGGRVASSLLGFGAAAIAATLGLIAFRSVPQETEPSQLLWLLPGLAAACALFVFATRTRQSTTVWLDGLTTAAGGLVGAWSITRFDALRRALIPSDAWPSLDRFIIAFVAPIAIVLIVRGLWGLIHPKRLIEVSLA